MQQASCRPAGPARRPDAASAANANNEPDLQHNLSHGLHGIETAGEITVAELWLGLDMSQYFKRRVTSDQERLGGSETVSDLLGRLERSLRFAYCAGCSRFAFGEWPRTAKGAGVSGGLPLVCSPNRIMLKWTVYSVSLNTARDRTHRSILVIAGSQVAAHGQHI